jgi:hypothetical protein
MIVSRDIEDKWHEAAHEPWECVVTHRKPLRDEVMRLVLHAFPCGEEKV